MFKKVIKYVDYNDKAHEDTFYFNLPRPELMEMKRSPLYEMQGIVERVKGMDDPDSELSYEEKDEIQEKMGDILRNLVIQSYGIKSDDGQRFVKRIGSRRFGEGEDFVETMAYDALYMELMSDINNLVTFVRAIVPADVRNNLDNSEEMKTIEDAKNGILSIAKNVANDNE